MLTFAAIFLSLNIQPLSLDTLTVERARPLHGQRVLASFLVAQPTYPLRGRTMAGAAEQSDDVERGAVLLGDRYDVDGRRIVVNGGLRVIDHAGGYVGGALVPGWVEIRVDEGK